MCVGRGAIFGEYLLPPPSCCLLIELGDTVRGRWGSGFREGRTSMLLVLGFKPLGVQWPCNLCF